MASLLKSNTTALNELLQTINNMPEEIILPALSNEGTSTDLLAGKELIGSNVNKVTGAMANNGDVSATIDGVETTTVTIPAGYTTGGTVAVDDTVETMSVEHVDLIEQISIALDGKGVDGGVTPITPWVASISGVETIHYTAVDNGELVSKTVSGVDYIADIAPHSILYLSGLVGRYIGNEHASGYSVLVQNGASYAVARLTEEYCYLEFLSTESSAPA